MNRRNLLFTGAAVGIGAIIIAILTMVIFGSRGGVTPTLAQNPPTPTPTPTASKALEPGERAEVLPDTQVKNWVGHGDYIKLTATDWKSFRSGDGYLIPRNALSQWAGDGVLIFEGEQQDHGIHDVLVAVYTGNQFAPFVGDNGLRLRNQGSFWAFQGKVSDTQPQGYDNLDDKLMDFAQAKRKNWTSQGMRGAPIRVWLSTGTKVFQPGEAITLTDAQAQMAKGSENVRCPTNEPLEENPFGAPTGDNSMVSQIGSYSCDTILIRGDAAVWFKGAKDGVAYSDPQNTRAFLVPLGWGEKEMIAWVKTKFNLQLTRWTGK